MTYRTYRVPDSVPDVIMDLLLPPTDRAVAIQWLVMVPFWIIVILVAARRANPDIRTFVVGLAMVNLAWFAARTIH